MIRRGTATRKHPARLAYLRAYPGLIVGVPGIHDDVTAESRTSLDRLVHQLLNAGLLGSSSAEVQRETVRRLVSECRGERLAPHW